MPVPEQWRCPKIGQIVRLTNGSTCEVVTVRKAKDVLRGLTEGGAHWLSATAKATYGNNWLDIYYEADAISSSGAFITITPRQVSAILAA